MGYPFWINLMELQDNKLNNSLITFCQSNIYDPIQARY